MLQVWGASIWRDLFSEFYGTDISSRGGGGWSEKCGVSKLYPFPPK